MVKLCSQNIFVWYIQTIENIRRIYKIVGKILSQERDDREIFENTHD